MIALLRQRLRRDGRQLALWIIGPSLLAYMAFVAVSDTFGTEQERASLLAAAIANPVILLFRGLPSGPDEGAFMIFLILPVLAFLAALMSTFLAVRHTRADEEFGRTELVAATPAGRLTPVLATAVHGLGANLVLALAISLAFLATGTGAAGAFVAGFAVGGVGVTFLGVGLLAAQLMRTSRGANAASVWTVAVMFLVCGLGNAIGTPSDDLTRMESSWLTWLSPYGWAENTRAYDEDNAWLILLLVAVGLALTGIALALQTSRDLGEAFIAARNGRERAGALLRTPIGLVWRLTRGGVLGWAIGGLVVGVLSTSLADVVDEIGQDNPALEQMIAMMGEGDIEQATVAVFFTMLGVLAASAAVQIVCRARQEEAHGTAEPVLSAPVDRVRWLGDYLIIALTGAVAVVAAAVAGASVGIAAQGAGGDRMRDVLVLGGGQVAAASVFLALAAVAFVLVPRLTIPLSWGLVMLAMVLGLFGPLFGFPEWLVNLSPVAVTPQVTGDEIDLNGLWWLIGVTIVGAGGSLALMTRRELATVG